MLIRRLGIVSVFIVLILGLHVWRGQAPDVGRSSLTGHAEKPSSPNLASPAQLPSRALENLKVQSELLPSPDKKRYAILEEILLSKNDNDPRLDSEFRQMSSELKKALSLKYESTVREKLNERGTLVFLLGREISTANDMAFIESVATELPCLGLTDCTRADKGHSDSHAGHEEEGGGHDQGVNERTLVYPQTVALKSLERYIQNPGATPALRQRAVSFLRRLAHHEDRRISLVAQSILRQVPPQK